MYNSLELSMYLLLENNLAYQPNKETKKRLLRKTTWLICKCGVLNEVTTQ